MGEIGKTKKNEVETISLLLYDGFGYVFSFFPLTDICLRHDSSENM